jgi:hypothetical protein
MISNNIKLYLIGVISVMIAIWSGIKLSKKESECGIVVDKLSSFEGRSHKSHTHVTYERYMVVRFDDGHYEDVKVKANTYYRKEVNDRICFERNADSPVYIIVLFLISCTLGAIFSIFILGAILFFTVDIIFNDKTIEEAFEDSFIMFR